MLDPGSRESLTEQLRPPAGYRLSHAIGTTFTLDMISALSVPLSFVRGSGEDPSNSVALLNAIRKVSDRIDIFCQAGLIRVPRQANDLLAVLEPTIHQVTPSGSNSLFHPKVWLLEFEADGDYRYRFLCSSRNLTPDTSWDLLVRLDGWPADTTNDGDNAAAVDNEPLMRFLAKLPELCTAPLAETRARAIQGLISRLASVNWELPPDIRTLAFRPLGTGEHHPANTLAGLLQNPSSAVGLNGQIGEKRNFGANRIVIAPFVDNATMEILAGSWAESVRVYGRGNEFERLAPETLASRVMTFNAVDDSGLSPYDDEQADAEGEDLRGLHAKAIFTDFDHTTHVLMGSANATRAAFERNVEFSVEMTGAKKRIGTENITDALKGLPFSDFTGAGGAERSDDEKADWRLQNALIAAATHSYMMDAAGETDNYTVVVEHGYAPPAGMTARMGLLTLPGRLLEVTGASVALRFERLQLEMVTPYVVIELEDTGSKLRRSTVVQGVLRTDIAGRIDYVMANQLNTVEKLRAFLLLFLTPEQQAPPGGSQFAGAFGKFGTGGSFAGLFEAIASAAASPDAPALFADLDPVMKQLYRMSEGKAGGAIASLDPEDVQELDDVRLLWDAAVAAVGEAP